MERITHTASGIPRTPLAFLLYVSREHRLWAFGALFAVSVAQVVGTSLAYLFRVIIDTAGRIGAGNAHINDLWLLAFLYPAAVGIMFLAYRISGFLGMQWVTRANVTAYHVLFSYLSLHSHSYFSDRFAGSLSSKVSHASEGVQSMGESIVWNYYPTIISLFLTIGYIATTNIFAALVFVGLLGVLLPLNIYLAKYRRPHVVTYSSQATKVRGRLVDSLTNITAVRQFVRRDDEIAGFGEELSYLRLTNIRQWRLSEIGLLINNVIIVLFEALILYLVVRLWSAGSISIGELVMIITLMLNVQGTLVFIGSSINGFIRRFGEIEEGLMDVLNPHEILDVPEAVPLLADRGEVLFDAVSFQYGENGVFKNLSLSIEPSQKVGLVGHSGAGKTTLVSLLLRQHDLTDGAILIDGQDIAKVTQDSLRRAISVVPQDPALFHRTIRENIAYGKPDATDAEIENAARMAQAHDFIAALPEGYDTLVGERGVKLSGGQRQRVAIARAMLKDAPLLVLDEATSSLDSESEVAIQKALHILMEGKTVVAIAHRLSTLREMDRIIVLENGKIVEDGSHGDLVTQEGTYARLWKHQAGGFIQE